MKDRQSNEIIKVGHRNINRKINIKRVRKGEIKTANETKKEKVK